MTAIKQAELGPKFSSIKVQIERITVPEAREYLKRNKPGGKANRHQRTAHWKKLKEAIREGDFVFNGETLKTDSKDRLFDGQHRLQALVELADEIERETGEPRDDLYIDMLCVHGLPETVFDSIDQGISRTTQDSMERRGLANPKVLAAALRNVWLRSSGLDVNSGQKPTAVQMGEFYKKHKDLAEIVDQVCRIDEASEFGVTATGLSLAYMATLIYLAEQGGNKAMPFAAEYASGVGEHGSPTLLLRKKLLANKTSKTGRLKREVVFDMMTQAFQAWANDSKLSKFAERNGTRRFEGLDSEGLKEEDGPEDTPTVRKPRKPAEDNGSPAEPTKPQRRKKVKAKTEDLDDALPEDDSDDNEDNEDVKYLASLADGEEEDQLQGA